MRSQRRSHRSFLPSVSLSGFGLRGREGPPPVISFGSRNYPINIVPLEDVPDVAPEDAPEIKKKKPRKRSKLAPKPVPIERYESIVSPYVDGLPRVHQAGQAILPRKLLHLAEGCMLAL